MASSSSFTSSSSSSPTSMKTTQFCRIQQTLFKKPNLSSSSKATSLMKTRQTLFKKPNLYSSKATSLMKRQETVFKKAHELSVLCGNEVCVIHYGSDGTLQTWPEDREKVKDIARRYSETKRRKKSVDLREFLDKVNKEDGPKKKKKKVMFESKVKYPTWDPSFDNYSMEQLAKLTQSLEGSLTRIQHRFRSVVEAQGQNTNLANHQELMMNQQDSNQVSMFLYNHGTGTLSQIPVSASTLNQAQSLANMGDYSGSLGVQETGISGFQNMNMFNYFNGVNAFPEQIGPGLLGVQDTGFGITDMDCYSNLDKNEVEDYLRLFGVEESTGTNGLQNMNMYNSSYNANGLSHQLVQTTAPAFLFGSLQKLY